MRQWLRGRTFLQEAALVLLLLAVAAVIVSYVSGGASGFGFVVLALILCGVAFRRELLWRVRNRLLLAYCLFGVVPILLIVLALVFTADLLLGHVASQRVRQNLDARIEGVRSDARNLALAGSHGATEDLLEGIRRQTPTLSAVVRLDGHDVRLPSDGEFQTAPSWMAPGFSGLFEASGRYFIGASVRVAQVDAFACLPLDRQILASLSPGVVSIPEVIGEHTLTVFSFDLSGGRLSVEEDGGLREMRPTGLAPPRRWWDATVATLLSRPVQTASGRAEVLLPLLSRPSLLLAGIATGRMASMTITMLISVGCFFAVVEGFSLFFASRLSRAITRSIDDIYRGTLRIGQGDFSHKIPVRGVHQLSELAASFNTMTAKIRQLIGEVRKKEKLDSELKIAQEVQSSLFPKSAPTLNTLELAGVCIPGRVVSGDYYDFVSLDHRRTAIALGDVSGKGVSAALLMASIQSALHAHLKSGGSADREELSMAVLMERISQQLYESTPPEKYATFFCSVYDDETGCLTYTNAGHLYPILVRGGQATPLEGSGIVAGLFPHVKYEQQDVVLQRGDLLAIFSDGIPEAMDEAQQEFGLARLAALLVTHGDQPLDSIVTSVTETVNQWIDDPEGRDDVTLVLLRRL
jgi:phosphoserine phosphatase RsbU/P